MHVLLVDDDAGFRAALRQLLGRHGDPVEVDEASDGEEALRAVARCRPDVVLVDLTMPRMNGVEATRHLKRRWPLLPVIVLTVHDDPAYERSARAAGADGFLLKKTAGTALWPALARLARQNRGEESGPGLATGPLARVSGPGPALARARGPVAPPPGHHLSWRPSPASP
jgi:DNA-binding NarL/FixJ family response regulator